MTAGSSTLHPVAPVFVVDRFPGLHAEPMGMLRRCDELDPTPDRPIPTYADLVAL